MSDYATRLLNEVDTSERVRLTDVHNRYPNGNLRARGGLRPDGGGVIKFVSGTMRFTLTPFTADVVGRESASQGSYTFVHDDALEEYAVTDGDPDGDRTDLVVARVRDDAQDASGETDAEIVIIKGDPTTGAVPSVPSGAEALWEVNVAADASSGDGGLDSGDVGKDRRRWTASSGGILPVRSASERDDLDAQEGQYVDLNDGAWRYDGSRWVKAAGRAAFSSRYLDSNQNPLNAVNGGRFQPVKFDGVNDEYGITWQGGESRWRIDEAGTYLTHARLQWDGVNHRHFLGLYVNGSRVLRPDNSADSDLNLITEVLHLDVGDTVGYQVYQEDGGEEILGGEQNKFSHANIVRVGG